MSYKTTLRSYDILRRVLLEELARTDAILKGELEADEAYSAGRGKVREGEEPGVKLSFLGSWNEGERFQ